MASTTGAAELVKWAGKDVEDEGTWLEKAVGTAAGGTLGFIEGNIPGLAAGGALGYELGKKGYGKKFHRWVGRSGDAVLRAISGEKPTRRVGSFLPKEMPKTLKRTGGNWHKTGTVKRKKTGRKYKKKSNVIKASKKLNRRVNKKIKKVVKSVLECDFNTGIYTKAWTAMYSLGTNNPDTQMVVNSLHRNDGNAGVYTGDAMELSPFRADKMLDAASVMYNGKAKAINYELGTNNFPQPKALKLNVIYASFTVDMVNNSGSVYDIDLYQSKPKEDQDDSFQTVWTQNIQNVNWVGGIPLVTTMNQVPGMVDAVGRKWSSDVKSFRLYPGQTKRFYAKFSGCVDFEKHYRAGTLQRFVRGMTQCWTIVGKVGLNNMSNASAGDATRAQHTGSATKQNALSFEISEVFKVQEPDDTTDTNQGSKRVFFVDYPVVASATSVIRNTYLSKNHASNSFGY